jgi:hypothetical protein
MNKYGSLKKTIEVLSQKLGNLESQTKPTEEDRDSTNIPKNEIHGDGKGESERLQCYSL